MLLATNWGKDVAVQALEQRRSRMMEEGQIDNTALPAGSIMFYYCAYCGVQVDVKPEGWWRDPPPKQCRECQDLIDHDWHDRDEPRFPYR